MRIPMNARGCVFGLTAIGALLMAGAAFAHAEVSPPVAKAKAGQVFTLAVPTEEENATTTTVEMTPPSGFAIDSFAPVPGWKRQVQQTGRGEEAVIQKVTWSGGSVPTGEDAFFQFLATPTSAKTYTFDVRQSYSNGKVVDWSGPESSDTPAPTVEAKGSLGGSSSLLAIVALVLGAAGVVIGLVALFAGRRSLA
ncbi:MAG: DUF1775 domain-containing protein [Actinobacteria bacterium]|nr:MAG: DUF1775 domain-containing protein [Actinomycetota bacterium]